MSLTHLHKFRHLAMEGQWKELERFFNESAQLTHMGIRIDLSDPARPVAIIDEVREYHRGGIGSEAVNGAIIAMLGDLGLGLLGLLHFQEGMTATAQLSVQYIKPLIASKVIAEASESAFTDKRIFGQVAVMNEKKEVCAYVQGSLARGLK